MTNNPKPVLSYIEVSRIENLKSNDSAQRPGACGSGDQVKAVRRQWSVVSTLLCAVLLFVLCSSVEAQQKKLRRVGLLSPHTASGVSRNVEAFRNGLRELGYIEGINITVISRYADGARQRLPVLANELISLDVDAIMTSTVPAIQAAMRATKTVPIVTISADPVTAGLVASLARPGGNVTGLSLLSPDLDGKRLEVLSEIFPRSKRFAFVWNPADAGMALRLKAVQSAAHALNLRIQPVPVREQQELQNALDSAVSEHADAIIVPAAMASAYQRQILDFTVARRLTAMYENTDFVEAGGVMAYGPSNSDLWRRAAYFVDRILKGAKPSDLPVEQPTKFELVINLKTAKQIGLTIPPNVLARADRVIR
jgi:putative tryptophan/tyrosine transport system substrate-binding protein